MVAYVCLCCVLRLRLRYFVFLCMFGSLGLLRLICGLMCLVLVSSVVFCLGLFGLTCFSGVSCDVLCLFAGLLGFGVICVLV